MKPVTNLATKENITMKIEAGQTIQKKSSTNFKVAGLLGLSAMILIAGATLLGIFVGKNMSDETYKEAWATYKDTDTNKVIKERIILDGEELSIIKPGEMAVIYDMNKNHVVMQINDLKAEGTDDCLCMVFDVDKYPSGTLEQINAYLNQTYIKVIQNLTFTPLVLQHSGENVDPTELSRKSLEMCLGCKISKMVVRNADDVGTRKKRYTKCNIDIVSHVGLPLNDACSDMCLFVDISNIDLYASGRTTRVTIPQTKCFDISVAR